MKTWMLLLPILIGCSSPEPAVERRCAHTGGMMEKACAYEVSELPYLKQDVGVNIYGYVEDLDGQFYLTDGSHRIRIDSIEESSPDNTREFLVGRRVRAVGMYRSETRSLELIGARRPIPIEQAVEQ